MDRKVMIASAVVGCLGLLSAILGFAAEGENSTPRYRLVWTWYGYVLVRTKSASAQGLGISAAIFLLVSQITMSAVSSCCGCCRSRAITSRTQRIVGVVVCAVFSWVLAVIAFVLFLIGPDASKGTFAGGGVLTLAATALGIASFIMLQNQPEADAAAGTTNASRDFQPPPVVIMVQPQTPKNDAAVGSGGEEQLPAAGVALDDPNKNGEKPQPTEASVGHTQSAPAAPGGTADKPPSHSGVTTNQPQPPLPHVYVMPQQPQSQGQAVQPLVVGVTLGQGQEQLQTPHVYIVQQQAGMAPAASLPQGSKPEKQSSIGNELLKAGVELVAGVVKDSLLSDNTDPLAMVGGAILSMATGADAGAEDSGDAAC